MENTCGSQHALLRRNLRHSRLGRPAASAALIFWVAPKHSRVVLGQRLARHGSRHLHHQPCTEQYYLHHTTWRRPVPAVRRIPCIPSLSMGPSPLFPTSVALCGFFACNIAQGRGLRFRWSRWNSARYMLDQACLGLSWSAIVSSRRDIAGFTC
jgi:hypothetical protein